MLGHNGTHRGEHRWFGAQLDAVEQGVKRFADQVTPKARTFAAKATETIKAHPIAATAIALGFGYMIVRIARREP